MSGRHQPLNGADSVQALADAIALVEAEDAAFMEVMAGFDRAINDPEKLQALKDAGFIVPSCIACELPALPNDIYCKGHARLMDYTSGEAWAAND